MSLLGFTRLLFAFACCVVLNGCLGTEVKTLGPPTSGSVSATQTDSDQLALTLAFRDTSSGTVIIQGQTNDPAANVVNVCGTTGTACNCLLYRSNSDTNPVRSASVGVSSQNNSLSCAVPAAFVNTSFAFVQIVSSVTAQQASPLISITTSLTLAQVLGNLSPNNVNGIFSYNCTRTFFLGEGVTPSSVTCTSGQHLGVITAQYTFFIFRGQTTSNEAGGDVAFPSPICGRSDFLKIECTGNTPELEYGFYNANAGPFDVSVTMTRAPEAAQGDTNPLSQVYGFAGLPDSGGNCPIGLQKMRPWLAEPSSIVQGSLAFTPAFPTSSNPPSSFINTDGSLNSTIFSPTQPPAFTVEVQSNSNPCLSVIDGTLQPGDCTLATFNGAIAGETINFTAITPVLCVIPQALINGLF